MSSLLYVFKTKSGEIVNITGRNPKNSLEKEIVDLFSGVNNIEQISLFGQLEQISTDQIKFARYIDHTIDNKGHIIDFSAGYLKDRLLEIEGFPYTVGIFSPNISLSKKSCLDT